MIYGYARVSTAKQASKGNSLEEQKQALRDAGHRMKTSFPINTREQRWTDPTFLLFSINFSFLLFMYAGFASIFQSVRKCIEKSDIGIPIALFFTVLCYCVLGGEQDANHRKMQ